MNIKWRFSRRSFELCRVQRILRWVSTSWNTHMKWTDNNRYIYIWNGNEPRNAHVYNILCVWGTSPSWRNTGSTHNSGAAYCALCVWRRKNIFGIYARNGGGDGGGNGHRNRNRCTWMHSQSISCTLARILCIGGAKARMVSMHFNYYKQRTFHLLYMSVGLWFLLRLLNVLSEAMKTSLMSLMCYRCNPIAQSLRSLSASPIFSHMPCQASLSTSQPSSKANIASNNKPSYISDITFLLSVWRLDRARYFFSNHRFLLFCWCNRLYRPQIGVASRSVNDFNTRQ